ncbi:Bug family tripartite tricarboxylate transporter substrate binding protein [Cupriavidus consociatus]|uniref:Bug family tripartite tricarboxylate transporter substrate binding protein n=1 Tax=Cupriavidus consociatus TaxID=2821357 RepID=UPI001AE6B3DB|nr:MULTISPECIES: tripartite tricarboxylate transporter substrate binding protein [unclassified Cupriavidus]MBP0623333.1 tripartite tricarboxylate transporter substrate binding protein [Cupriavidus sp. LEh25]MDK2660029.1 tripartite tricarboxylate transporter substrate binding protein [Cupriavidus sp. LEh21]
MHRPFVRTMLRHMTVWSFALSGVLPVSAGAQPAPQNAADFPSKAIRYVVPFAAGGLTDNLARLVGQQLAKEWKKPIVVDNRPGGNANIGGDLVAKAPADGYTWLAVTLTHASNVTLFPKLPFNLQKDLVPVARIASSPMTVVVPANSPIRSMKELAQAARRGKLSAGSSGNGTAPHLTLALFESQTGASLTHVPYKGGTPSMTDLIGGQIDVVFSNLPESLAYVKGGKLRALAVTTRERNPLLPDVPTVVEAGFPDLIVENWTGLMMPAATPRPIVDKVAASLARTLQTNEMRERIVAAGFTPTPPSSAPFAEYFKAEVTRWSRLIDEKQIRVE